MTAKTEIELCVEYVAKKEGAAKFRYVLKGSSSTGDGYLGGITFVELTLEKKDTSVEEVHHLVVKMSENNPEFKARLCIEDLFKNEIFMYCEVYREYAKLEEEKRVKEPYSYLPKFYGHVATEDRICLIMEDVGARGFTTTDRRLPLNVEHLKRTVEKYAKYHALGFALRDQKPDVFRRLAENHVDLLSKLSTNCDCFGSHKYHFRNVKESLAAAGELEVVKDLEVFERDICFNCSALVAQEKYRFVFIQGDCWNTNIMFKYENKDTTNPKEVCIIDWQLSRIGSPVVDLSSFIYATSSGKELEHFDDILDTYYTTLSCYMRQLGSDPEQIFPHDEFMRHYRKYCKYGLVQMLLLVNISLCESDEGPDLIKVCREDSFRDFFSRKIRRQDEYNARIRDIYIHASKRGFLT